MRHAEVDQARLFAAGNDFHLMVDDLFGAANEGGAVARLAQGVGTDDAYRAWGRWLTICAKRRRQSRPRCMAASSSRRFSSMPAASCTFRRVVRGCAFHRCWCARAPCENCSSPDPGRRSWERIQRCSGALGGLDAKPRHPDTIDPIRQRSHRRSGLLRTGARRPPTGLQLSVRTQ